MFTFPFVTVDNSLHSCCTDLKELCNESEGNDIPDSFYGQNHFAASTAGSALAVRRTLNQFA